MPEPRPPGHILVVDDDTSVRGLFVEVLHHAGYVATAVDTMAAAAAVLDAGEPEIICVLLDGRLPDGHAVDLLRRLRRDGAQETLPVIVITADDSPNAEIAGLDAGATDYLCKPVSPDALVARVAAHLRDRAAWLARLDAADAETEDVVDLRRSIRGVIDGGGFRPVFQPIVDLDDGRSCGFEALTRFDDGVPPDRRFPDAAATGLGVELELATLTHAVAAAVDLPSDAYVSLNVTPSLLRTDGGSLRRILATSPCPVVLEITEREAIDDYDSIRTSLRSLDPDVQLSIDDAGSGFSSLRHVVMLEPDYVKLDRTWVTGIDTEPTKQALVAGLVHFARTTGCQLVAEGIETEIERAVLVDLGVGLGQGFLLGRPERAG